jgi:p-hydroxybenzoate 3-monooxygenase
MNLAIADVRALANGFAEFYRTRQSELLDAYSSTCLRRVWKAQRFSWWMTQMLHQDPTHSPFDRRRQMAEIDYITSSETGARSLAENYVGLPFD